MPLTPHEAALRRACRAALAEFGVPRCRLTLLANRHNDVFRVDTPSRERFVLRLQNDLLTDDQATSQLWWLRQLGAQTDVAVPAPTQTTDGRPFTHVEYGGRSRRAVLLQWVPGRPTRRRDKAVFRTMATMTARLHRHAEALRPPTRFTCRRLDADGLFGDRFFLRVAGVRRHVNAARRRVATTAEPFVRDAMIALGHGRRRFGLIHADLNFANVIFHCGRPSPIDFDEFGQGWFLFDLAELIRTSITPDNWQQRKALAIDAYTRERALDDLERESFDAFIVATFVQYLNWAFLHARDADDLRWVNFSIDVIERVMRIRNTS